MKKIAIGLILVLCGVALGDEIVPPARELVAQRVAALPTSPLPRPVPGIERALIVSIDGLRPDVALRANTPNIHHLFQNGAFTFWARTTEVSITLPSHTSMLTGAVPLRHGVDWNNSKDAKPYLYPFVPTIFELAHRVGYTTAMAAGKLKFVALNKPGTVDYAWIPAEEKTSDADVADHAVQIILEHKPQLMFVHFPSTDNVGHAIGWGTPAQIAAVEGADAALGRVLAALTEAKTIDSTVIILTADHGGQGRGHGKNDARSRHIPWIAVGPGIKKNVDLTTIPQRVINTEDTFATVCWLLGVPVDEADIDGKPVTEILARKEMLEPKK